MTLRRRMPLVLVPATLGAGALVAALLPMTTAQAEPAPASPATVAEVDSAAEAPDGPIRGSMSLTMSRTFVRGLAADGVRIAPVGTTTRTGRTLTFEVYAPSAGPREEIVLFTGGLALRAKSGKQVRCDSLALVRSSGELLCGRGDRSASTFTSLRMFQARGDLVTPDTEPDQLLRSPARTAAPAAMARVNRVLGVRALTADQAVGRVALTIGTAPARASRDSRSSCEIDDVAGDLSINRGWAIQALVNQIPKDVTVSQFDPATGKAPAPDAAPVAVGQRTPYMEKLGTVTQSKEIIRGSEYRTDKFWSGPTYGCNNWAPFVVGQGGLDEQGVQAWSYDGVPRGGASDPARSRTQWWGHARQTSREGPTGFYTWTCRGLPTGPADTFWERKNSFPGFVGDTSSPNAGRAPECQDENMDGFTLTTRYSISKRGHLEAREDQIEYPRYCSVDGNDLVGCWQQIYPLEWARAWGFQYHVYASALRAVLDADTRIRLSSEFADVPGTVRPLAWRISDAQISGAWPNFTDADGVRRDMSGVATPLNQQDLSTPSAFTVPAGLKDTFTLAGYGTPMGNQQMTFLLTGDTDGSWEWPSSKIDGRPLPRPQVRITLGYTINNFDDGGSCKPKMYFDDKAFDGKGNDRSGVHCIQGQVPTIWPLPENSKKLERREIDTFITDKDGKRVRNTPTTTFEATVLASCFKKDELTVQDNSVKSAPVVGADYTWNIRLAGTFTQLSGC